MKKLTLLILMITIMALLCACGTAEEPEDEYQSASATVEEEESSLDDDSIDTTEVLSQSVTSQKELIAEFVKRILGCHTDCEITSLTIFDAHNPNEPGTYHCRAIVTFIGNDSADVAGKLIQAYSDELAEKADFFYPALTEMDLIWMAPEFHGRATLHYEKVKGYLQITSTSNNSNFGLDIDIEELEEETIEKAGAMTAE